MRNGEEDAIVDREEYRRFFGNERSRCNLSPIYALLSSFRRTSSLKGMQIEEYVHSPNNWTLSGIGNTNKFM